MENKRRLIDANAANIEHISCYYGNSCYTEDVQEWLDEQPTIDAVEVKCKVGDLVYALWEAPVKPKSIIYCEEVKEIRISMRNCRLTTTYILEPIAYRGHRRECRDEDFGTLVFKEQEEAEAALAKMDGDENV